MRVLAMALLCLLPLAAEEPAAKPATPSPAATEPAPLKLSEVETLKFQNLNLRFQIAQHETQSIQLEYANLNASICNERKIPLDKCVVDPNSGTISRAKETPPVAAKPQK